MILQFVTNNRKKISEFQEIWKTTQLNELGLNPESNKNYDSKYNGVDKTMIKSVPVQPIRDTDGKENSPIIFFSANH